MSRETRGQRFAKIKFLEIDGRTANVGYEIKGFAKSFLFE